jgi:hypothetical protein
MPVPVLALKLPQRKQAKRLRQAFRQETPVLEEIAVQVRAWGKAVIHISEPKVVRAVNKPA